MPGEPKVTEVPLIERHVPEDIDTLPLAVAVTAPKPGMVPVPLMFALAFMLFRSITMVIGPEMFTDVEVCA
jgi:hypothetical protein